MSISNKVLDQMREGSWIRQMFEKGLDLKHQYGEENVFDLSLGNPSPGPAKTIQNELIRLASDSSPGAHQYMPNAGYTETRRAVARYLTESTGLRFSSNEVIMTVGAAGALNVILKTILEPADEVIIFSPYFPEYKYYIDNAGGQVIIAPTDDQFQPNPADLEHIITDRTRAILINSPNNPTGVVYPRHLLDAIGHVLRKTSKRFGKTIFLLGDEPYRRLTYDDPHNPYLFDLYDASIIATSYSKDLGLAGERIGYIAVNPLYTESAELINGLTFCNRTLGFVNAPGLMQRLVCRMQDTTIDVSWYRDRRDLLYKELTNMGYQMVKPAGAFYMFPKSPLADDVAFVEAMLRWKVLIVPGKGFGSPGHFRISYSVDDRTLLGALDGFGEAAREFRLTSF